MDLREQLQSTLGGALAIERELGGGGMSRVFVAQDAALGRAVVIKVLAPELSGGVNVERFKREIALAVRLQHPHIVPLLAAGEVGGLPYFTMPFIEGESLRGRISRGELPVHEAVSILRDLAKAIDYAHSKGVIHRDIKPDNVLLTGGSAAVTDFGVAKAIAESTHGGDGLTAMGVALGTPAYMAPEQASADPATDHRADIYAFGATAYEMLTGRAPFAGRPPQQMLAAHATESPTPLDKLRPAVPQGLSALVMSCLEKRPSDRPQTARELLQALEAVTTPAATVAMSSRIPVRAWVGVGVFALLAVAVGAFVAMRPMRRPSLNMHRVMVAPFDNLTGDSSFSLTGKVAADWITRGVSQLDSAEVVPSNEVFSAFENARPGTGSDPNRIARGFRAGLLVSGSYYRTRDSIGFQAQVIDASSGRTLRAVENVMAPVSDPREGIRVLRDRIMGGLAMSDDPRQAKFSGGLMPRIEAYNAFLLGVEKFDHRMLGAAIPLLERAVALDSTFSRADLLLAQAHANRGEWAVADSIVRVVEKRRDELAASDRALLDLSRTGLKGDVEAGYQISHALMEHDSSWVSMWLTANQALYVNRPRESVKILTTTTPPPGWSTYFVVFALAYHAIGDHSNELRIATRGNLEYPGLLVETQLRALGASGDVSRIGAILDSVVRASVDTLGGPARMMLAAALEMRAHGHDADASPLVARARAWLSSRSRQEPRDPRALRVLAADVFFAARQFDSAQARYSDLAAGDTTDYASRARVASAAALRGDTITANRIDDQLSRTDPPYSFGEISYRRAMVAAALGHKELTVQLLTRALAAGSRRLPEIHRIEEFQALKGYEPFEAILRPKG